jgi:phage baseplate assembly protein gpV
MGTGASKGRPDSDDEGTSGTPAQLGDGPDGVYDRIEHKYNRQAERIETKDQNGTVRAFDYDVMGQQIRERVLSVGEGVDGSVRRIETEYDIRGLPIKLTCYDTAEPGTGEVVNELLLQYNAFALLTREYQSHSGPVDPASTLYVEYSYADGPENHTRQTSLRYPNGRLISYDYAAANSLDDAACRVRAIVDGTQTLAEYK